MSDIGNSEYEIPILDHEQMDALRLDAESISPSDKARITEKLTRAKQSLLQSIGRFVRPELKATNFEQNFIVTDQETSKELQKAWENDINENGIGTVIRHSYSEEDEGILRCFQNGRGNFVVGYFPDWWDKVSNKDESIKKYGGEDVAKEAFENQIISLMGSHELTHQYQNPNLPLWLNEAAAYYYARRNLKKMEIPPLDIEAYDKPANFFQKLLGKYGGRINKIVFSDPEKIKGAPNDIDAEFTEEIQKEIFPGLKKEVDFDAIYRALGITPKQ